MKKENSPIDNLTEKTFKLLGTLQEIDPDSQEWQTKFFETIAEQYDAITPFLRK
jgi:hypothetical protein